MCNLYTEKTTAETIRRLFKIDPIRDRLGNRQPPLQSIYPRYDAPVVRLDEDGHRELINMHWGFLLPQVSKKTGKPILPKAVNNARDDKLRTSPFWRESFEQRRCLIPATAFCEAKGRNPATFYWFGLKDGEEHPLFAFAGIWRTFDGLYRDQRVELSTYSMITTAPNSLVAEVHPDRMPVILDEDDYETWLTGSPDRAFAAIRPFPKERMELVDPPGPEAVKVDPG